MKYRPELGVFGNLKEIFRQTTRIDSIVIQNKIDSDQANLQLQADIVESVIDEYNALTEV